MYERPIPVGSAEGLWPTPKIAPHWNPGAKGAVGGAKREHQLRLSEVNGRGPAVRPAVTRKVSGDASGSI